MPKHHPLFTPNPLFIESKVSNTYELVVFGLFTLGILFIVLEADFLLGLGVKSHLPAQ